MNIIIKTEDAKKFFGSVAAIAELTDVTREAIYQWGENVPELSAWRLFHISKKPKFRRNKLKAIINV